MNATLIYFCPPRGGPLQNDSRQRTIVPSGASRLACHDGDRLSAGCRVASRPPVTRAGTKATWIRRSRRTLGLSCAPRVCPIQDSGQQRGLRAGVGLVVA